LIYFLLKKINLLLKNIYIFQQTKVKKKGEWSARETSWPMAAELENRD
jgi:hypothetical protein